MTICTENRKCLFGNIKNGLVYLSEIGQIIFKCWLEIPKHFNVILDDWIIMPNHLHGIIKILNFFNDFGPQNCSDTVYHVATENKFGHLKPKSLSSIINTFKGAAKRHCNKNDFANFAWQKKFYEHIIKNEDDLSRIRKYIANNPINWEFDRNNPDNF